jgi:hypothetical protein
MKDIIKKIILPISYVAMIVVNALANSLPINGISTGAISDSYPNLFAPAGITFSIWGVIYLLLAGYVLFYSGFIFKSENKGAAEKISNLFILTCITNIAWLFSWHYGLFGLSVIIMITFLIMLIKISTTLLKMKLTTGERLLVRLPFSVYFGWITVATIANISTFLVSIGWNGFGLSEVFWTILILIIGAGIGLLRSFIDKDIAYCLVFVWAYIGIMIKHLSPSGFSGQYEGIITTLTMCLVFFVLMVGYLVYKISNKK